MTQSLLFLGSTGYIGGQVLSTILNDSTLSLNITAVCRSEDKADKLKTFGVDTVVASLDHVELIEQLASQHDIVINASNGNHEVFKNIIEGLKKRKESVFLQVSGAATIMDDAKGRYTNEKVYSDLDVNTLNNLPKSQPRKEVHSFIVDCSNRINAHIILPSTVYGTAKHALALAGISNTTSVQIPQMVKASIKRKQAGVINEGLNKWGNVYIEELGDLFLLILKKSLSGELDSKSSGLGSYFFASSDEHDLLSLSRAIGSSLSKRNIGLSEPSQYSEDEIKDFFNGSYFNATNARISSDHSKQIGWMPVKTNDDLYCSIDDEIIKFL